MCERERRYVCACMHVCMFVHVFVSEREGRIDVCIFDVCMFVCVSVAVCVCGCGCGCGCCCGFGLVFVGVYV